MRFIFVFPSCRCPECAQNFENQDELRRHRRSYHYCVECTRQFCNEGMLNRHRITCVGRKTAREYYYCPWCGRQFDDLEALKYNRHWYACGATCQVCQRRYADDDLYADDDRYADDEPTPIYYHVCLQNRFVCLPCGRVFENGERFEEHSRTCRRFPCSFCKSRFDTRNDRDCHQINCVDKERVYHCKYCSKRFNQGIISIERHQRKCFKMLCEFCLKVFLTNESKREHEQICPRRNNIHSCNYCGFRFASRKTLTAHERENRCPQKSMDDE